MQSAFILIGDPALGATLPASESHPVRSVSPEDALSLIGQIGPCLILRSSLAVDGSTTPVPMLVAIRLNESQLEVLRVALRSPCYLAGGDLRPILDLPAASDSFDTVLVIDSPRPS